MSVPTSEILNRNITAKYQALPRDSILAEYVWIGGSGADYRCKTRTLPKKTYAVADLPEWNFDGSSTGQAPGDDSEVIIRPVRIFKDPFRGGDNILVLCDCAWFPLPPLPPSVAAVLAAPPAPPLTRFPAARLHPAGRGHSHQHAQAGQRPVCQEDGRGAVVRA